MEGRRQHRGARPFPSRLSDRHRPSRRAGRARRAGSPRRRSGGRLRDRRARRLAGRRGGDSHRRPPGRSRPPGHPEFRLRSLADHQRAVVPRAPHGDARADDLLGTALDVRHRRGGGGDRPLRRLRVHRGGRCCGPTGSRAPAGSGCGGRRSPRRRRSWCRCAWWLRASAESAEMRSFGLRGHLGPTLRELGGTLGGWLAPSVPVLWAQALLAVVVGVGAIAVVARCRAVDARRSGRRAAHPTPTPPRRNGRARRLLRRAGAVLATVRGREHSVRPETAVPVHRPGRGRHGQRRSRADGAAGTGAGAWRRSRRGRCGSPVLRAPRCRP